MLLFVRSCSTDSTMSQTTSPRLPFSAALSLILFFFLLALSFIAQGSDGKPTKEERQPSCICEGRLYYKECPKDCPSPTRLRKSRLTAPRDPPKEHDVNHPDHVEDSVPVEDPFQVSSLSDDPIDHTDSSEDGDVIVRHRKVYLSDKESNPDPIIHPITLTIPVKGISSLTRNLPPPKPFFKMHKYITYEDRPKVEMVPVTTTIIKPVGVSKDQIIYEDDKLE